jgi:hypothetical protein
MARIFNSIRQRLLSQNRFTRYLIYAIGEIVLVVIGILIALQINNYSEIQKLRKKEVILLNEMKQNLTEDLADINFNLRGNKMRIRANDVVLETLGGSEESADSLEYFYGNLFGNFQLSENTTAWQNLKSIGVDLISDDSLRSAISYLYSNRYIYLENLEKGLDDRYQWDNLYPLVLEHIDFDQIWVSGEPVDQEKMMNDRKFKQVIKMNLFIRNYLQVQYGEIRDIITALIRQIDRHLNERSESISNSNNSSEL